MDQTQIPGYVNEVSPTVAEIWPKCIRYQMGIMFKIAHSSTYCRSACQAIVIYSKPISTVKHRKLHKKLFLCHFSTMEKGISKRAFSYQATWTLIKPTAVFFFSHFLFGLVPSFIPAWNWGVIILSHESISLAKRPTTGIISHGLRNIFTQCFVIDYSPPTKKICKLPHRSVWFLLLPPQGKT